MHHAALLLLKYIQDVEKVLIMVLGGDRTPSDRWRSVKKVDRKIDVFSIEWYGTHREEQKFERNRASRISSFSRTKLFKVSFILELILFVF